MELPSNFKPDTDVKMQPLLKVLILVAATLAPVLSDPCDHLGVLLYEDLGCTPHYNDSISPCPIRYSCQGLEPSSDFCYFRGRPYKDLETIEAHLLDPSCDRSCLCFTSEEKSDFVCAVLDCPEWLSVSKGPDCYRKYSLDQCCSVGERCPPFTDVETCVVDGVAYKEGEQFYPKNTCQMCVCQKGYRGVLEEPFCRKWSCGVQLKHADKLRRGCAPWYDHPGVHCCPVKWICPDGSEEVAGVARSDDVCRYGENTLKVGQTFDRFDVEDAFGKIVAKVECKCIIPPLVTCLDGY